MIELRHVDVRHFVIYERRHLSNGCTIKWRCIDLILFRYESCLAAIICDINTIGLVSEYAYTCRVCDALVASCATARYAPMKQNGRSTLNGRLT